MGVYNEVFKKCPFCEHGYGYVQIGYLPGPNGGYECSTFNLDNLNELAEKLDEEGLRALHRQVKDERFWCGGDDHGFREDQKRGCGQGFLLVDTKEQRIALATELFT